MIQLNPASTALVLIDLQKGILGMPLQPRSGSEVFANSIQLADRFRAAGATVVRVRVGWAKDYSDAPSALVDSPVALPPGGMPDEFAEFPDDPAANGDLIVTKRHWGAFHGTELDLLLRRRGVRTLVIGGIATNFGVESTARSAWEYGYDVVIAEDTTASRSSEMHAFSIEHILPRIARVVGAAQIHFTAA
jgi:nicotinamidase-related amidase